MFCYTQGAAWTYLSHLLKAVVSLQICKEWAEEIRCWGGVSFFLPLFLPLKPAFDLKQIHSAETLILLSTPHGCSYLTTSLSVKHALQAEQLF